MLEAYPKAPLSFFIFSLESLFSSSSSKIDCLIYLGSLSPSSRV